MRLSGLIAKQQRFAEEYLVDLNATQAAIRAGYSPRTAAQIAYKLVKKSSVQAAIRTLAAARSERTQITADRVLRELHRLAVSDVRELFGADGSLRRAHELPDSIAPAVAVLEEVQEHRRSDVISHRTRIKLWDKNRALENLGRHLKLFTDKVEVGSDIVGALREARRRVNRARR